MIKTTPFSTLILSLLVLTSCGGNRFSFVSNGATNLTGSGSNGAGPDIGTPEVPAPNPAPNPEPIVTATPSPTPTPPEIVTPTPYVEGFKQNHASSAVDIVWMIDSSGSMGNDQQNLANNAAVFTNILKGSNVDFRMMVISAGSDNDAELSNQCKDSNHNPTFITSSNADLFSTCPVLGSSGANHEEGIEATRRALDPQYPKSTWNPNATPAPLNPSFLRAGADLQLIFVSDEEDQPDPNHASANGPAWPLSSSTLVSGGSNVTVPAFATSDDIAALYAEMAQTFPPGGKSCGLDYGAGCPLADTGHPWDNRYAYVPLVQNSDATKMDHTKFFNGLKASTGPAPGGKLRAHAINIQSLTGASGSCNRRDSTEEAALRYKKLALLTGGSASDICGDWNATMNSLGLEASGLERCFQLAHVPTEPAAIFANVNGVRVNYGSGLTYEGTNNQVCFDTVPPVNSLIVVWYH